MDINIPEVKQAWDTIELKIENFPEPFKILCQNSFELGIESTVLHILKMSNEINPDIVETDVALGVLLEKIRDLGEEINRNAKDVERQLLRCPRCNGPTIDDFGKPGSNAEEGERYCRSCDIYSKP